MGVNDRNKFLNLGSSFGSEDDTCALCSGSAAFDIIVLGNVLAWLGLPFSRIESAPLLLMTSAPPVEDSFGLYLFTILSILIEF